MAQRWHRIAMSFKEAKFHVFDLHFSAQHWDRKGVPVVALHGWLDNAASFNHLASYLPQTNFLALDLAGHGFSGHRPTAASYAIWDDVAEVLAITEQLGWDKFCLIGHSRGAAIATMIAAVAPEKVIHLTWIDGGWPMLGDVDFIPQLRRSVEHRLRIPREKRVFPTLEHAVTARRRGMFQLTQEAANELTIRGVEKCEGGYRWRSDSRLMDASEVRLTLKQMHSAMAHIECDIGLHHAEDGREEMQVWRDMMRNLPGVTAHAYPGSHHLHMEGAALDIANHIKSTYIELAISGAIQPGLVSGN